MTTTGQQQPDRRAKAAAELARMRTAQRRRRAIFIGIPALCVVVIVVLVVIALVTHHGPAKEQASNRQLDTAQQIIPAGPYGTQTTVQETPTREPNKTGISGVLAWNVGDGTESASGPGVLSHDHVTGPVTYAVTPPVGGPHDAVWMNAGVYTKAIPAERAVHNLEHGAVWITYQPDLSASDVTALRDFVTKQSLIQEPSESGQANRYIDLSPWSDDKLPAPIVISSWGYQLRVTSPTDPRLQQFVDMFRNSSKYSPEYGSPVDGIPIQTGGRPALDGSAKPNPAGSLRG